jgi:hypothetical protein
VRKTTTLQTFDILPNEHRLPIPEIQVDRSAFGIQQEIFTDFEVAIAIGNRNFPQIPTSERHPTQRLEPGRDTEGRK